MERQEVVQLVSLRVFGVRLLHTGLLFSELIRPSNTARSLPVAFASCAFLGAAVGTYDSAGRLAGERRESDSPETWEERRKRFFKQKPTAEFPTDA